MKKIIVSLFLLFIFLFGSYSTSCYADSAGSQGDLTFVDGTENDKVQNEIQSPTTAQKPKQGFKLPYTGETKQFIWIVTGAILLVVSSFLLIIKKKSRRSS